MTKTTNEKVTKLPTIADDDIIERAVKLAEVILGTWNFAQIEAIKDALVVAERRGENRGWSDGFDVGVGGPE